MDLREFYHGSGFWSGRSPVHRITALAFAPSWCLTGSTTGELVCWSEHRSASSSVSFSPFSLLLRVGSTRITALTSFHHGSESFFVAGTHEGFLSIWTSDGGKCICSELSLPWAPDLLQVAELDSHRVLIAGSLESSSELYLLSLPSLKLLTTVRHPTSLVTFFVSQRGFLVSVLSSGACHCFDLSPLTGSSTSPSSRLGGPPNISIANSATVQLDKPITIFLPNCSLAPGVKLPETLRPISVSLLSPLLDDDSIADVSSSGLAGTPLLIVCRQVFFIAQLNRFDSSFASPSINIRSLGPSISRSDSLAGCCAIEGSKKVRFAVWTANGHLFLLEAVKNATSRSGKCSINLLASMFIPPEFQREDEANKPLTSSASIRTQSALSSRSPASQPLPFTAAGSTGGRLFLANERGELLQFEAEKFDPAVPLQLKALNADETGEFLNAAKPATLLPSGLSAIRDAFDRDVDAGSDSLSEPCTATTLIADSSTPGAPSFSIARGYQSGRILLFRRNNELIELLPPSTLADQFDELPPEESPTSISHLLLFSARFLIAANNANRIFVIDFRSQRVLSQFQVAGCKIQALFTDSLNDYLLVQHEDLSVRVFTLSLPHLGEISRRTQGSPEHRCTFRGLDSPLTAVYSNQFFSGQEWLLLLTRLNHVFVFNTLSGNLECILTNTAPQLSNPVANHFLNSPGMNGMIFMESHGFVNRNSQMAMLLHQHIRQAVDNTKAQAQMQEKRQSVIQAPPTKSGLSDKLLKKLNSAGHNARSSIVQGLSNIVNGGQGRMQNNSRRSIMREAVFEAPSGRRVRDAGTAAAIAEALSDWTEISPETLSFSEDSKQNDEAQITEDFENRRKSYTQPSIDTETRTKLLQKQQARLNEGAEVQPPSASSSPALGPQESPVPEDLAPPPKLERRPSSHSGASAPSGLLKSSPANPKFLVRSLDFGFREHLNLDILQVNIVQVFREIQQNGTQDANINAILALYLDWNSNSAGSASSPRRNAASEADPLSPRSNTVDFDLIPIEQLLINEFAIQPPLISPSPVCCSDYNQSFSIMFPNRSSRLYSRYEFTPLSSALHTLVLSFLSTPLLLHNDFSIQENWSKITNFASTLIPVKAANFVESDLSVIASYCLHANIELSATARLMLQGIIERASKDQKLAWMDKFSAEFAKRYAAASGSQGPASPQHPTGPRGSVMALPGSGGNLFNFSVVSDSDLMFCILLCQLAATDIVLSADVQLDSPLLTAFRRIAPQVSSTMSRLILGAAMEEIGNPRPNRKNENSRLLMTFEFLWRGLSVLHPFVPNQPHLLKKLFNITLLNPGKPTQSTSNNVINSAQRCLLEFGRFNPSEFLNCVSKELNAVAGKKVPLQNRQQAANLMCGLVKKCPLSISSILSNFIQVLVSGLDPSDAAVRRALIPIILPAIEILCDFYPMVFYHPTSHRLWVGTGLANNNLIICNDLIVANRTQVYNGHTGEISALTVNLPGSRLLSYSAMDASIRIWMLESKERSTGLLSNLLSSHQSDGKCLKVIPLQKLQAPSAENQFYQDGSKDSKKTNNALFCAPGAMFKQGGAARALMAASGSSNSAPLSSLSTNDPAQDSPTSPNSPRPFTTAILLPPHEATESHNAKLVAKCLLSIRFLWKSANVVELTREDGSKVDVKID